MLLPEHIPDSSPHHDPTPSGGNASLSPACIHGTLPKTLFQNGLHLITMIYFSVRFSRWTVGSLRVRPCLFPFVPPAFGLGPATLFANKQTCPVGIQNVGCPLCAASMEKSRVRRKIHSASRKDTGFVEVMEFPQRAHSLCCGRPS